MAQYVKAHVSKHAKDRAVIEEQKKILAKFMREAVWQRSFVQLECRFEEPATRSDLGNGCYWKRAMAGAQ